MNLKERFIFNFIDSDRWRYLWDGLGATLKIGNAGGGTVMVTVNGKNAGCVHTRTLEMDISKYVQVGENEIEIEVTSSLTNRMIQREYMAFRNRMTGEYPEVRSYGIKDYVRIEPYKLVEI